ncbi:protein of unknown function DUF1302 [Shewanella halifaxensis HAW-EB4]|uniref:PduX n=1 Tax=Shewanella halifaxensis (strain HAW-EB4) TaxID=458817 RepID=B0TTX8_SHEHH|nr:DUF1302 family protein [Shewanella halifaxensis]ABZ76696.1 protein of unknown function DUF1302 [Shewanella halifaxensis HAW-EB4]
MQNFKRNTLALAILGICLSSEAYSAETINLGDDVTLDWKGTLTYSVGMRLDDPDPILAAASDGDAHFEKHDLIGNGLYLLLESHLRWGNSGLVVSGSTFYDEVYQSDEFSSEAQKWHGGYTRLLDLYAYTAFAFGDEGYLDLRVGQQVVAWGEALFFPSISLAQGPSDAIKSYVPGTEVKDILLPEQQVSVQAELTNNWSVMAHWQFNWEETIVPSPGTFFSTSQAVGYGAYCLQALPDGTCAFGPRGPDIKPDETSQWGVGSRYRITDVTELGLYYLNYNDRIPMVEIDIMANAGQFPAGAYNIRYFDNIALYGATLSTSTGPASIGAEVTYKDGAPALVTAFDLVQPSKAEILQANLNAIVNFGRTSIADATNLTIEASYVDILDVDARNIGIPGTPDTNELYYDDHSLAIAASLTLSYPGIFESWDMSIPLAYSNQLSGRVITGGVGGQGDNRARVGISFTHNPTGIQTSLDYVGYYGNPDVDEAYKERTLSDRDNIGLNVKWAF